MKKSNAYIIKNGEVIASTTTNLKNGASIEFSYQICQENINASREYNLVNSSTGKISRAKKWDYEARCVCRSAIEINPGEFQLISSSIEEN